MDNVEKIEKIHDCPHCPRMKGIIWVTFWICDDCKRLIKSLKEIIWDYR